MLPSTPTSAARPWRRVARLAGVAALAASAAVGAALVPIGATAPAVASTVRIAHAYGSGDDMAADPAGGYWTTSASGVVDPHGGATSYGSLGGTHLNRPIVGMASTPDGAGYWLVASDGGVFAFGDAAFFGSTGGIRLNKPIVGMASTPDGNGYWLVASDGGVFNYGDASFYGSTGGITLNKPIVGLSPSPDGKGYWLVASDGGVFTYGDTAFDGSTGSIRLNQPIIAMAPTPDGGGYWLVAADGGIFTFGDAPFEGSLGGTGATVEGVIVDASTDGYALIGTNGGAQSFGNTSALRLAPSGNTGSVALGVYDGPGNLAGVESFGSSVAQPTYAMDFLDGTSWSNLSNPTWFMQKWHGTTDKMIWGVPMLPNSGASLTTEATGAYNLYFEQVAQTMVQYGFASSVIRLGWEFNTGMAWYDCGNPGAFVGAYQQVVDSFRAVPGANFTFEWNPDIGNAGCGNLASYYPGDSYVNDVGLDVYDGGWNSYPGAQAAFDNFETQTYGLDWLTSFAAQHGKVAVIPEWGLGWGTCSASGQPVTGSGNVCGGDDPTFVNDMVQWAEQNNVSELTFWDYGSSTVDNGSNPNTAAALRATFG